MTELNNLSFYAPWPLFGKKLNQQWGEIRANQETLAGLAKAIVADGDANSIKNARLAGLEFGEENFHNRFRVFWNKGPGEFEFQCNRGTEIDPIWDTAFYINCDPRQIVFEEDAVFMKNAYITGTFYGLPTSSGGLSSITVKDTNITTFNTDTITFHRDDFYLTPDSNGKPVVNALATGSGGGGISGIIFTDTEGAVSVTEDTFIVNRSDFYLTLNSIGKPILNSSGDQDTGITGITVKDTNVTSFDTDTITFNRDDFYLTPDSNGKPVVNALASDSGGGGITGVTFTDTAGNVSATEDTFIVNRDDFYLTLNSTGKPILNSSGTENIGITGITVKDTNVTSFDTDTITFNRSDFYLTPDSTGKPVVNALPSQSGGGGSNVTFTDTADNVSATEDTFIVNREAFYLTLNTAGKPILNFAGQLIADPGDNVVSGVKVRNFTGPEWQFEHNFDTKPLIWNVFNSDDEAIIPDAVDVSDPNTAYFYFDASITGTAIITTGKVTAGPLDVEESKGTPTFTSADRMIFNSDDFYLTSNSSGKPVINALPVFDEKSISIEFPSRNEDVTIWRTARDISIDRMSATLLAADSGFYPRVDWTIRFDSDRFATGTEVVTGGTRTGFYPDAASHTIRTFDNPNIPVDNWVWFETTNIGEGLGVEKEIAVTITFS